MLLTILIIFLAVIGLLVLHELGHFLLAKKFGVKVEEFGIGYPPRIFGKKIGETIYSLNLLPFGAFVRIVGEEERIKDERSFSQKPIWQRALILLGGVASFWLVAFFILTLVAGTWGLPTAISDDFNYNVGAVQVQIINVAPDSPAEIAGLRAGDTIEKLKIKDEKLKIDKIKQIQDFVGEHLAQQIILAIKRGKETFDVSLTPRTSPPPGEGAIGIALARVVKLKYPWYKAPVVGAQVTAQKTVEIPMVLGLALAKVLQGEKVTGMRMVGPIGIGQLMSQALE